ncbi:MAG: NADH-quinone oxidoreductase subunit L [Alphaproteobacteria bacterium]|nr:NADH-quinone oxidoreductase subunit L [Alphaproteobacteria bacterium]
MSNFLLSLLIVFSPLASALIALCARGHPRFAQSVTCLGVFVSFIAVILLWINLWPDFYFQIDFFRWLKVDSLRVNWGVLFDSLSLVMCAVVTFISLLVHIYSIGYMKHDEGIGRFMAYLSLFTFMMLLLVSAPNIAQLFVGWEGVGLSSYLLIGFWYEKPKANNAAFKAFVVNRIGDAGLILGICALFWCFESLDFSVIVTNLARKSATYIEFYGYSVHVLTLIGVLLFIGAMGKSAQFGLHTWLPDAMEGPTPVSALIHAATMVTAGVFLIVRFSPLYEYAPLAREMMVIVGALTAIFAATVALTQNDIKRVIAYSTCSQLGYMVLACGCSAYVAAIFHLVTHAFFKALLFLGAGSLIHAMSDEQNIQKMGGIYKFIPATYTMMWIGSLALAGIPFFSGYYSKDLIISSVFLSGHQVALAVSLIAALLTAFYSWRLLIVAFHGKPRADEQVMAHIHESPMSMLFPLYCLAFGAICSGWLGWKWFIDGSWGFHWGHAIVTQTVTHSHLPIWAEYAPALAGVLGITLATLLYKSFPLIPEKLGHGPFYKFFYNKWYIDEIYQWLWVKPILIIGSVFWRQGDRKTIDGLGPEGLSKAALFLSRGNSSIQSGYTYHYAFVMLFGVIFIITFFFFMLYKTELSTFINTLRGHI